MRVLFDQGTPAPLRGALTAHIVSTAYEMGWSTLSNGDLLDANDVLMSLEALDRFGWPPPGIAARLRKQHTEIPKLNVHVHDNHATILHLMGIDHTGLVYRYAGRDFRLTDVDGNVIPQVLS